jgi:hypothetical protein
MLQLTTLLALTSALAAPAVSPAPAPAASASAAHVFAATTRSATGMTAPAPSATEKKHIVLELPAWTRQLTVGQQQEAMRAELDAEFNVDHSP